MAGRLDTALVLVGELSDVGELRDYHLLQATRGDLLRRLGRDGEAAEAYRAALGMARTGAERRYLTRRLAEVGGSPPEQTGASVI
jgi:RNA polymerase sigma-70 factor (ECF subfamily)